MGAFSAKFELVSLISGFCSAGLSSGGPPKSEDEVGTTDDAGAEPPETEDILEDVADGNGLVVELGSSGLISLLLGACWASLASLDSALGMAVTTVFDF
jgi:hypothetical protein